MKKVILFLFAIVGFNLLLAQKNKDLYQEKFDSIQNLLNNQSQDDTVKVKRLNELARIYFYRLDYLEGLIAAKKARELAEQLKYRKGEGLYLRTIAFFNDNPAFYYYSTLTKWFFRDIKEKEEVPVIGDKILSIDSLEKRNSHLFAALKFFEKEKDRENIANILIAISYNLMYLKRYDDAVLYADKSKQQFQEINKNALAIFPVLIKNFSFEKLGKNEEAKKAEIEANLSLTKLENEGEKAILMSDMSNKYFSQNRPDLAIEYALKCIKILEKMPEKELRIQVLETLAEYLGYLSMSKESVEYYKKAIALNDEMQYIDDAAGLNFNLAFELITLKKFDDAEIYLSKAKVFANQSKSPKQQQDAAFRYNDAGGRILLGKEKYHDALKLFYQANDIYAKEFGIPNGNAYINIFIAQCYQKLGNLKESIRYGEKSRKDTNDLFDYSLATKVYLLLSEVYEELGQQRKSFAYLKKYNKLLTEKEEQNIASTLADTEIKSIIEKGENEKNILLQEKQRKEIENQNQRWWLISVGGALFSAFVLMFLLYRNNQNKQKANALLQKQKGEIESTLSQLESTQSQLIQSEKMASLGELTAGIAHEIQNPLNFVNNFSEVNGELISEMKNELLAGNKEEAISIANDIEGNGQKILHHGKRADAIVKGMLQHSRVSTGQKEPTDINKLADEYLRLSYHGMRAKDKSFNATLQTEFDATIGKINVVPQDIGRVLLNLFNNAFYAVTEKVKQQSDGYEPAVSVCTKKVNGKVEIHVKDNGNGIPQKVVDKIFQPFFTTKPTGMGTGLGLSLSYDIIKAHTGEIRVDSNEGEGSEFIVLLPA